MRDVFLTDAELVCGFGFGKELAQKAVFRGETAFSPIRRFPVDFFACTEAAVVPGAEERKRREEESLCRPMIEFLAETVRDLPEQTPLLLASTVGEIDRLSPDRPDTLHSLLKSVRESFRKSNGCIVSGACASASVALDRAYRMVAGGVAEQVIVAACDLVSEFAFSGFYSLGAMSAERPRPYDRDRSGLYLGEAAGVVILSARRGEFPVRVTGTGMSGDARHITAPQSDGQPLASAMRQALSGTDPETIGCVLGHGTGTIYNDSMEIAAIRSVLGDHTPLASVKANCGHTLGASGILQAVLALEVLRRKELFPQAGLRNPERGAEGMVSAEIQPVRTRRILSLNSGFGGINAALALEALE